MFEFLEGPSGYVWYLSSEDELSKDVGPREMEHTFCWSEAKEFEPSKFGSFGKSFSKEAFGSWLRMAYSISSSMSPSASMSESPMSISCRVPKRPIRLSGECLIPFGGRPEYSFRELVLQVLGVELSVGGGLGETKTLGLS